MDQSESHAARTIADHRIALRRLGTLPSAQRPRDEDSAYRVQDELHRILSSAGMGAVAGHKIGCTTPVMQAFLNIDHPCAGGVFANTIHASPARVPYARFVRAGVECEMVVRLKADLAPAQAPFTRDAVAQAVDALMPGMEIVDDRYVDYKSLDTPTLIADDFFDAGCVLGAPVTDWRELDLATIEGVTLINGREVGRGRGADVMGHPFEALAWLANALARRGRGLKAGEFVFTGSVVATIWLEPGDDVEMRIAGLGEVRAVFD